MSVRHGAGRIEAGDLPFAEFADRHTVVHIAALRQTLVDGNGAGRIDPKRCTRAEKPARNIDIVDAHVQHGAAAGRGKFDEKAAWIVLVGSLRTHEKRTTDHSCLYF